MSSGFCCCWYFGEYDDKDTNNANLNNPLLRVDDMVETRSEAETEFTYEEYQQKNAVESVVLPSWTVFETTHNCWACDLSFEELGLTSVLEDVADSVSSKLNKFLSSSKTPSPPTATSKKARNKRHHCRRCRNVFCADCTDRRSRILLLEMETVEEGLGPPKQQRVCERCATALEAENFHLLNRHFLLTAQPFKKHETFGLTTKFVRLAVSTDFSTLIMTTGLGDSGSPGMQENARRIPMGRVTHVELKGLTAFEIHWDGGEELGQKRWSLEGDTHDTASKWVQFLSEAARRAREPSLKLAIELERKQKIEKENRAMKQAEKAELVENRRRERAASRQALKERYAN